MDPITFQVVDETKLGAGKADVRGDAGNVGLGPRVPDGGVAPRNAGGFEQGFCGGVADTAGGSAVHDGQRIGEPIGVIDSVPYSRAFFELFEGAIYLHQARQYLVNTLDVARATATVKPVRVDYYTQSRNHTDVDVTKVLERGTGRYAGVCTGCVSVVSKVWGWRKVNIRSNMVDEMRQFDRPPPPLEYHTRAFWIDVSVDIQREIEGGFVSLGDGGAGVVSKEVGEYVDETEMDSALHAPLVKSDALASFDIKSEEGHSTECCLHGQGQGHDHGTHENESHDHGTHDDDGSEDERYSEKFKRQRQQHHARVDHNFIAAVHALNHVLAAVAPLFVSCDPQDIDTEHVYPYQQRPRPPRVVLFDKRPGGVGVAEALYHHSDAVLAKAEEVISSCPCPRGCPSCIFHNGCSNYNTVLNKRGALIIVRRLLARGKASKVAPGATKEAVAALHQNASPGRRNRMNIARSMDGAVRKQLQGDWL